MNETWLPIKDYEDYYEVSNLGRIRNKLSKRIKWQSTEKTGYKRVSLSYQTKKAKIFLVHRLVAIAFIDNNNNFPEVHHIDHNKSNNLSTNLSWTTPSENQKLSYLYGNSFSHNARSVIQLDLNENVIEEYKSISEASRLTKTSITSIRKVCNKETKTANGFKWQFKLKTNDT